MATLFPNTNYHTYYEAPVKISANVARIGDHYYAGFICTIPDAAIAERKKNWHEIAGAGAGYASVSHPAWSDLYDYARSQDSSRLGFDTAYIMCVDSNAKCAHIGTIAADRNKPGHFTLNG